MSCSPSSPQFNLADFDPSLVGECTDFTAVKSCIGKRSFCNDLTDLMDMRIPFDAKINALIEWIKYLKSVIAMYVCEFYKELTIIKQRLDDIEAELVDIQIHLAIIDNRLDVIENDITNIWNTIQDLQTQINNVVNRVTNLEITVENQGDVFENRISALELRMNHIITNLINSGAWNQITNNFNSGRNIATGNINLFGGIADGSSFIRTNNGSTQNDIAAGI